MARTLLQDVLTVLVVTVVLFQFASGATVSKSGKLTACEPECTEYAIVIIPTYEEIYMKVYKFERRNRMLRPSDVRELKPSLGRKKEDVIRYLKNPLAIVPLLELFIKSATKTIPKENHPSSPVYFFAPSYIKRVYPETYEALIIEVTMFFNDSKKHPFLPASGDSIRTVDGKEQVRNKWMTVNFLQGAFLDQKVGQISESDGVVSFSDDTNVQIAFSTHMISSNVTEFVTIDSIPYFLVAKSSTNTGFGAFLKNYFDNLNQTASKSGSFKRNHVLPRVMKSPCSPGGAHLEIKNGTRTQKYVGNGDIKSCRKTIRQANINDYQRWTKAPYIMTHSKSTRFYAFPDVIKTLKLIGCFECDEVFTPAKIDDAARRYCKKSKEGSYTTWGCINANFIYLMLTEVYHFDDDFRIPIRRKRIRGIKENWALGAVLYQMGLI